MTNFKRITFMCGEEYEDQEPNPALFDFDQIESVFSSSMSEYLAITTKCGNCYWVDCSLNEIEAQCDDSFKQIILMRGDDYEEQEAVQAILNFAEIEAIFKSLQSEYMAVTMRSGNCYWVGWSLEELRDVIE